MSVNLFDFDGTIYNGDSTIDFYLYALRKDKFIILLFPIQALYFLFYKIGIINKKTCKQKFFIFLKRINDVDDLVIRFWEYKHQKINKWYLQRNHHKDIIITASPDFLIRPIAEMLNVKYILATLVDKQTGEFLSENCYGEEKVKRLSELAIDFIEEAYSDDLSDLPMLNLAVKKYLVKDGVIKKL